MNLASLREATEHLTRQLEQTRARFAAGLDGRLNLAAVFHAHAELARWDSVDFVREAQEKAEGRRAVRLTSLGAHLRRLATDAAGAGLLEELAAASLVRVPAGDPGAESPLRLALSRLADDGDRDRRALIETNAALAVTRSDRHVAQLWEHHHAFAQKGGAGSAAQAWAAGCDADLAALAADAEAFLKGTDAMYADVADWWVRRATTMRPFPDGAQRHDLLHAMALTSFAGLFPRGHARVVLEGFASAGLEASGEGRIRFDSEPREHKQPQPFVTPSDVAGDVIAVYRGEGGFRTTRDLLRAWGEAQAYAHVDPNRPFEDRLLGDRSVPRAFGVLFQNVLLDRKWLKSTLGAASPDLARLLALAELFRLRHAAAVFLHSLQIDREGFNTAQAERYSQRLSEVLRAHWPAGLCAWECVPAFDAGVDLLAAATEAALLPLVLEQGDEDWWRNPSTGVFLKKLFAQGQLESSRVLIERLTGAGPRLVKGVARFQARLN